MTVTIKNRKMHCDIREEFFPEVTAKNLDFDTKM